MGISFIIGYIDKITPAEGAYAKKNYRGHRFIVEMKLWHEKSYNKRGQRQLLSYLDYHWLDMGYLLSFNFNKNKQTVRK